MSASAGSGAARRSAGTPTRSGLTFAEEHALLDELVLRDALTRERLAAAAARLHGLEILTFDPDWWDGQAHTPCLVVRGGRRDRLQRIVETAGECVIVPFPQRRAERRLAQRRAPSRPELLVPSPRQRTDVVVDASGDAVRCATPTCGVLRPVDGAGGCPMCGN